MNFLSHTEVAKLTLMKAFCSGPVDFKSRAIVEDVKREPSEVKDERLTS